MKTGERLIKVLVIAADAQRANATAQLLGLNRGEFLPVWQEDQARGFEPGRCVCIVHDSRRESFVPMLQMWRQLGAVVLSV